MSDFTYELARLQIEKLDREIKVIIVHPNYYSRNQILSYFFDQMSCFYLRIDDYTEDLDPLIKHAHELVDEQTRQGAADSVLIVDQCDLVEGSVFTDFLNDLVHYFSGRIVLFSRKTFAYLHSDHPLRSVSQIVPRDESVMLHDYATRDSRTALLEVRALGSGHVLLNGIPVDEWDGELPRNLFFYLIDKGIATRNQIFETFWPNLNTREATNVFHVTKRKISEVLKLDLTYYSSGFYRISPEIELSYDVSLFAGMLQGSVVAPPEEAGRLLERAIWLYRGGFLTSIDARQNLWVEKRRQELMQSYGDALIAFGKLQEENNEIESALGCYVRASATNRQREDLAGSIMTLYMKLNMHDDALKTYQALESEILNSLGISPAQWLQDLAADIREREIIEKKREQNRLKNV
ncbi:MAG: bacterial transcriptional activator domain-containing protein [Anaerolineae bacterium]|nr:bacterial transcriptional activator domain-containing protein [Anaerolineae bacterium]